MKKDVRVAVVQMQIPQSVIEGEKQIDRLVGEASSDKVDIVGLAEDCLVRDEDVKNGYDPLAYLSRVAKKYKVYLFGATMVSDGGVLYNRGFFFDRRGKLINVHNKVVLTPPEVERGVVAGETLEVFNTEFGRMSILVCKDSFHRYASRFFEKLQQANVDIVLVPSYSINVAERSIELWVDSLKALAKWFDVYIVASGTVGKNTTPYDSFGHALIICPKRVVLAEGSKDKEEILRATLDVESLEDIRNTVGAKWQPKKVPMAKLV